MIQSVTDKSRKPVAYFLFAVLYLQTIVVPLHAAIHMPADIWNGNIKFNYSDHKKTITPNLNKGRYVSAGPKSNHTAERQQADVKSLSPLKVAIGGPGSPEAASFKAVGSDNLVNLFTGDFSYSIPLLDVGGYPVNLFYNGGIGMEQEASWVGLGWNINPGTVSRNMRGVPDDFNGDDKLVQTQNVKPNRMLSATLYRTRQKGYTTLPTLQNP